MTTQARSEKKTQDLSRPQVTIRFAGDSGDGIQVTGSQFSDATAELGNDLSTFPDYPSEIRAPSGTIPGVSGYQIQFSSHPIHTPGDQADVLVAFNPAALRSNLSTLAPNGVLVVNRDAFSERDLHKAGYEFNPLEGDALKAYQLHDIPITTLTLKALEKSPLKKNEKARCKNFYALGLIYWLYSRPIEPTLKWFRKKFAKRPDVAEANAKVLKAGYAYGEATESFASRYVVPSAPKKPGTYRNISGNSAMALGLVAACHRAKRPLFYGSYPITPASEILHDLARYKTHNAITFQAEDEIAAVCASIGASFAGAIGITGTSGPGLALKSEAINLAVMTELPLVVVNVQRGGPSTGLPTKTEQGDLLQALYGRNGESPVVVMAPQTPADCFDIAFHAVRIATRYMVPVFILSDGYLANGAEPWRIPSDDELPQVQVKFRSHPEGFQPYLRDDLTLSRPWAVPGMAGLEHRIGGLEKSHIKGTVCHDPENHDFMVRLRQAKVERVVQDLPKTKVFGPKDAKMLLLGWGSSFGAVRAAAEICKERGLPVAHAQLRFLNPFPSDLEGILRRYERVLVPELNMGQLRMLLRSRYLLDVGGINKVAGRPFRVEEILVEVEEELHRLKG